MPNTSALSRKETASRDLPASPQRQHSAHLSLVERGAEPLTKKEQEACNRATD